MLLLSAGWQRQEQPDGLCCAGCDDWGTRSVGRWQLKWFVETTGCSRLGFKLYLVLERQFSWRVISVHKTPHYFPVSTRLIHRLQVCYWVLILRRSTKTHCKPEFPPSLSLLRRFSGRVVRCVEMGWQFLIIHHLLKCPELSFDHYCNLRDGQGIPLYSYAPTIHNGVVQIQSAIHKYQTVQDPQQCSVTSYRVSRRHIST